MNVTTTLAQLDRVDGLIEDRKREVTELRASQQRNPELQALERQLTALRAQQAQDATQQRDLERDLAAIEERVRRGQTRMYSGQIVDARELGSLERELEHLGVQRGEIEGRLLETMERNESLDSRIAGMSAHAVQLAAAWETDKPQMADAAQAATETLAKLREQREALVQTLDARILATYTRLRSSLGHAISPLNGDVCGTCRVQVTQRDVQHARAGTLAPCPNCGRILYAGASL